MAEGEDVLVDVARHGANYAQALWRRRAQREDDARPSLAELAPRLTLLIRAVSGLTFPLRVADPPAPPTLLARLFRRAEGPVSPSPLPATDGASIWLPASLPSAASSDTALAWYRVTALQQAVRAVRGSVGLCPRNDPLLHDAFLLFEVIAADADLVRALPGLAPQLQSLRAAMLAERPAAERLPAELGALESVLRRECASAAEAQRGGEATASTPADSLARSQLLTAQLRREFPNGSFGARPLYRDLWLGELREPPPTTPSLVLSAAEARPEANAAKSARLQRRPRVRKAEESEDESRPGAWMVQTSQPQEKAEDPHGLQRPTDRDTDTAADELADALGELPEARLVVTASKPREYLLTDDPPEATAQCLPNATRGEASLTYPEWDYRAEAYREGAVTVHVRPCEGGAASWVEQTLERHRSMLQQLRRHFELLRGRRARLRKQVDGDELDLEAYLESQADFLASLPRTQRLYQAERRIHRDLAIVLLVDVSGSTDGWVAGNRRIIDVEREALLLVCVALESLGQPYAVQTFSGEGPERVVVRSVKAFDEGLTPAVARRISSLEPESYTRVGAAVRHATASLLQQPAQHRLLLLLSDGKPNDVDEYSGRYGVEDARQAVNEAKLQGSSPFCLTIDRQAPSYLPHVFGAGHYALLTKPERLPVVLLDWVRRLVSA